MIGKTAIDETGNKYGPYVVIERTEPNYEANNTACWICECVHCGETKIYSGNSLRFGHAARKCKACGGI